jgi:hypothetical protein
MTRRGKPCSLRSPAAPASSHPYTMKHIPAAIGLLSLFAAAPASAAISVTISQQGADVVATYSGTANLADLTFNGGASWGSMIWGDFALGDILAIGADAGMDVYSGVSVSPGWDILGGRKAATSSSGDLLRLMSNNIGLPEDYVSGQTISGSATWTNTTLEALGLTEGNTSWSWGAGVNADSVSLTVNTVPEPGPIGLASIAVAGWALSVRSRGRRHAA